MKKLLILILLPLTMQAQTIEECQRAAADNYPLIRQYNLIEKTSELTASNIDKAWLPQITASAQATYQSDVTAWPDGMRTMMQQMGMQMKGLKKDQYRVGIDVQQTIFDGGAIKSQKEIARQQAQVEQAQNEVTIYAVHQRVNDMYFAALLLNDQILLNNDLQTLLKANEQKLVSMVKNGTAAESDLQNVKAERLNAIQQHTNLESQRRTLLSLLSTFCGIEVKEVVKPTSIATSSMPQTAERPELKLIDANLRLADAQEKALNAALLPKLGIFAQGFYGYPGFNMFEDMMNHDWSWNGMIGARLTWNIGALYTRKNDKAKIQLQREKAEVQRNVFMFNNSLEQKQHDEDMARYQRLMADDNEIIELRSSVRRAAESKLAHGIIDTNDLLREINAENAAKVQQSIHEIQMQKAIYDQRISKNLDLSGERVSE